MAFVRRRGSTTVTILMCLLLMIYLVQMRSGSSKTKDAHIPEPRHFEAPNASLSIVQEQKVSKSKPSSLNILTDEKFPKILPEVCRQLPEISDGKFSKTFLMCAKPYSQDKHISGDISDGKFWEKDHVTAMLVIKRFFPDALFLDLGSNIGMFSVTMAVFGHRVMAVDPIDVNLAYIRASASISGVADRITYVQNSISDKKMLLYPWRRDPSNEGGTIMLPEDQAKLQDSSLIGEPVESVTFEEILDEIEDNVIVMKVDIEGYECKALRKFMKAKKKMRYIPVILMEWDQIAVNKDGFCPELKTFFKIIQRSGYKGYNVQMTSRVGSLASAPADIIWIHEDAHERMTSIGLLKNHDHDHDDDDDDDDDDD